MDHIPLPAGCSRANLEVPFLVQEQFDGLDFAGYPQRRGWPTRRLSLLTMAICKGEASGDEILSARAFLQSWLYFGFLESIIGQRVDVSKFITRNNQGRQILNTARLPELLSEWAAQEPREPKARVLQRAKGMNMVLGCAGFYLRSLGCGPKAILSSELWLSMAVLYDILTLAKLGVVGHRAGEAHEIMGEVERAGATGKSYDFLREIMSGGIAGESYNILREAISGGTAGKCCDFSSLGLFELWCPYDVERLSQMTNNTTMYFAGLLSPRRSGNHSECTRLRCSVASTLPHSAQHRTPECQCLVVNIRKFELDQILDRDAVPVISLSVSSDQKIAVSIRESQEEPYIAFSHVWSDGLGNETENALTTCQLVHLNALVGMRDMSDREVAIWIDTLCVPISGAGRKKAIALMARTYREAQYVLALDRDLQLARSDVSHEELLLNIVSSRWSGRLWTLQEGAFAKKLYIQFRDKSIDLDELIGTQMDHASLKRLPEYVIYGILHNNLRTMRELGAAEQTFDAKRAMINGVINLLLWRQTTKPVDEWTCFSTLLGHDVTALLEAPPSQRPIIALEQQVFFPSSILFNSGLRQDIDGFRWAPKSFLRPPQFTDQGTAGIIGSDSSAICTPQGLFVKLPALELFPGTGMILGSFEVFEPLSRTWLRVVLCDEETSVSEEFDAIQPRTDGIFAEINHQPLTNATWVLIFQEQWKPRTQGEKDIAVIGYVLDGINGPVQAGFRVKFVQRVVVVTTAPYVGGVVPGPNLSSMHGQLLKDFPWYIG